MNVNNVLGENRKLSSARAVLLENIKGPYTEQLTYVLNVYQYSIVYVLKTVKNKPYG